MFATFVYIFLQSKQTASDFAFVRYSVAVWEPRKTDLLKNFAFKLTDHNLPEVRLQCQG